MGSRTRTVSASPVQFGFDMTRALIWIAPLAFGMFYAVAAQAQANCEGCSGYDIDITPRPPVVTVPVIPNPKDNIVITIPGAGGKAGARGTLRETETISGEFGAATSACAQSSADVGRYLSCLSDAMDDFANELDRISADLPPGMRNVARIVQRAKRDIDQVRTRTERRLVNATSEAEREQIRREALSEASNTLTDAANEIRKSITLVRAQDPELANIQRETVVTVAAAVDGVAIQLRRAVDL